MMFACSFHSFLLLLVRAYRAADVISVLYEITIYVAYVTGMGAREFSKDFKQK